LVADNWYLIEDGASQPWSTWLKAQKHRPVTGPTIVGAVDFVRFELGASKPIMRREFLRSHDLWFDPALRYVQDFPLFLRCILRGGRFAIVPEASYYYRSRPGALTRQKMAMFDEILVTLDGLLDEPAVHEDRKLGAALDQYRRDVQGWIAYYRVIG